MIMNDSRVITFTEFTNRLHEIGNYSKHHIVPTPAQDHESHADEKYDLIDYGFDPSTGNFIVTYTIDSVGTIEPSHKLEIPKSEFLDFLESWSKKNTDPTELEKYKNDGRNGPNLNWERFWNTLSPNECDDAVRLYINQKKLID